VGGKEGMHDGVPLPPITFQV